MILTLPQVYGQSPKDTMVRNPNIDVRFLEKLCLEVFNDYRYSKVNTRLIVDSVLCKSSIKHSELMQKNKKLEHGNSGFSGENILFLPFGVGVTYEDFAKYIIKCWIESPEHNQNMLDSYHKNVGLGIKLFTSENGYRALYVTMRLR
jgi:uncharacterized protein YkwD